MAKKIPIEKLHEEMKTILDDYAKDISDGVDGAVRTVAQKGATAVRGNARETFGGTGVYAHSWGYRVNKKRLSSKGIIYSKMPGLPHLLEYGHAKRGGGRVMGRVHIAPVEAEINQTIEAAIKEAITK